MPSPPLLTSSFFPSFFPFASFRLSNVFLTKPHPCPPLQSSSLLFSSQNLASPLLTLLTYQVLFSSLLTLLSSPLPPSLQFSSVLSSPFFFPLLFLFHLTLLPSSHHSYDFEFYLQVESNGVPFLLPLPAVPFPPNPASSFSRAIAGVITAAPRPQMRAAGTLGLGVVLEVGPGFGTKVEGALGFGLLPREGKLSPICRVRVKKIRKERKRVDKK